MESDAGAAASTAANVAGSAALPALATSITPNGSTVSTAPLMSASLAASASVVPRDAVAIEQLLASMGLPPGSYQPRIIAQLLEFSQRYQREILEDAQEYCKHRDMDGKAHIDVDDVELAVQSRLGDNFTSPPPKELLYNLAQARNSLPLPIVPTREGVHLPADRFCLMQPNYRIKPALAQPQAQGTTWGQAAHGALPLS